MTISQSLDQKFIRRLKYIIQEQQNLVDSLTYDLSENSKKILRLASEIVELSERDKDLVQEVNEENYFLEKFNSILQLHLTGDLPVKEIYYEKDE